MSTQNACLLKMFVNKLNDYEPGLMRNFIIPDVQAHLDRVERAALVKKLHLEWWDCYYVGDCESVEQEMAMHNVTVPSIKEYEEMYGLTFPDGFWDY